MGSDNLNNELDFKEFKDLKVLTLIKTFIILGNKEKEVDYVDKS